jgi:ATP-dependent Clp protease ATP-binding subunit ClpA
MTVEQNWESRLLNLESELSKTVPAEEYVITRIARAIRKNQAGLCTPGVPIARFLFIGPTEPAWALTTSLARFFYGDEHGTLRLSMRDYSKRHNVLRLIGFNGGRELSGPLLCSPRTSVLLDELELAHFDAWTILIDAMENGYLIDGPGHTVSLSEAIFVMTTRVGYAERLTHDDTRRHRFSNASRLALEGIFRADMLRGTFIDEILMLN